MSTCLEANNIPSIGLIEATTTSNGAIGVGYQKDSLIYLIFTPAPSGCDYIVRYTDSSTSNPCGIVITRIAILEYSELEILINIVITFIALFAIMNVVGQWL